MKAPAAERDVHSRLQAKGCIMASWLVPPVVIPAVFTIMIIAYALYRAQG
jgi:hypothetical protein